MLPRIFLRCSFCPDFQENRFSFINRLTAKELNPLLLIINTKEQYASYRRKSCAQQRQSDYEIAASQHGCLLIDWFQLYGELIRIFISPNSFIESHATFYLEQSRAVVSGQRQPGSADSVHRRFGRPLHRDVLANVAGKLNHIFPFVDTVAPVIMKALKYLSLVGKLAGFVTALGSIPFVDPKVGIIVFAAASLLKDSVNCLGDLLDDGQPNSSFKG